ncbi:hypothetical protein [Fibrisoma montanum]|uniref:hypothetical protein n=1 Tax=Fibrisoma montanum TaxID=2305895 RepID=UPI0011C22493|nr:hypothetical protein [Fibrisoma montanum]
MRPTPYGWQHPCKLDGKPFAFITHSDYPSQRIPSDFEPNFHVVESLEEFAIWLRQLRNTPHNN